MEAVVYPTGKWVLVRCNAVSFTPPALCHYSAWCELPMGLQAADATANRQTASTQSATAIDAHGAQDQPAAAAATAVRDLIT